jgi:psp operon transcriptional activator
MMTINANKDARKLIGESPAFLTALEKISRLAALNKPVLIIGERGTGKELMAERLHFLSPNWDNTLIKLNCAAIPENLLESELFGHEAGAFTGASKRHIGRFEQAHGGTLFLDEIANMSLRLQEKLLRVVEYGEFERVGGRETLQVNVRIVGAANMDLPQMVRAGKFRADLLDRLSFDVVTLPPLRYRQEDIPMLARFFATGMIKELRRDYFAGFADQIMQALIDYEWPGNLRELKNVIERAVYRTAQDEMIESVEFDPFESPFRPLAKKNMEQKEKHKPECSPPKEEHATARQIAQLPEALPQDLKAYMQQQEKELLALALKTYRFNQRKTAEAIGLSYHQIRAYLRKYPDLLDR